MQQLYYVTGEVDLVVILTVADMAEYERLTRQLFFAESNVKSFRTHGGDGAQQGVAGGQHGGARRWVRRLSPAGSAFSPCGRRWIGGRELSTRAIAPIFSAGDCRRGGMPAPRLKSPAAIR